MRAQKEIRSIVGKLYIILGNTYYHEPNIGRNMNDVTFSENSERNGEHVIGNGRKVILAIQ